MTERERKEKIAYHRAALKELQAVPRSDWHAGFEALLRIETYKYGDRVRLKTEEVLGEEPPRTDYVILIEDQETKFDKDIFKIFRKFNILEYKNPHDTLNERVIRKICGYANFFIGLAEHEGEVSSDQVTISIFRAVKNPRLFKAMEKSGSLIRDKIPGIYHVVGITDLPFQIIITSELEGNEYSAYRALTDTAKEADIENVLNASIAETDDVLRNHYRVYMNLLTKKNPKAFEEIRRDSAMEDALMNLLKDKVDERVNAKERDTLVVSIRNLMTNLKLSAEQAMDALNIPPAQRSTYAGLINSK